MPAKLIIESDLDKTRQEIMFDKPRISLGRKAGNDLHYNRAEISGNHAAFLMEAGQYYIQDNGSTNGTLLNGAPVVANEKYPLQDQDLVTIAPYRITFMAPRDQSSTMLESHALKDLRTAASGGTVYEKLDKVATGTAEHSIPDMNNFTLPENAGTGTDPDIRKATAPVPVLSAPAPEPEPAPQPAPAPAPAPAPKPRPAAAAQPKAEVVDEAAAKGPSGLMGYIGLAIGAVIVIVAIGLLALILLF